MGANIHQLQQALESLEVKAGQLSTEIHHLYQAYVATLGQSVSKQLLHAVYHLCTQAEPEAFLELSLGQQQSLQQDLQKLTHQLQISLEQVLSSTFKPIPNIHPDYLVSATQQVEDQIVEGLRHISRQANHRLQDQQILHIKSMDTLFKMAVKADDAGRSITSPPHLLKALVEAEDAEEEDSNVPVVAIYLQITDIELADPALMNCRHQLRQGIQKLIALNKDFAKKQQAQAIAKAEAAWRASWFLYQPSENELALELGLNQEGVSEAERPPEISDRCGEVEQESDSPPHTDS
ncbi:MAG: hypothetical protein ACFCU8_21120 [Thermosynechococcaceae cyanobacterium]